MIQEHNTRRQVEKEKRKWYRLKKKKKETHRITLMKATERYPIQKCQISFLVH